MDERIRTLAQKWQPSKRLRTEEQNSKALDTDMIIVPCLVSVLFYAKHFFFKLFRLRSNIYQYFHQM